MSGQRERVVDALARGPEPAPAYLEDVPDDWILDAAWHAHCRAHDRRARMLLDVVNLRDGGCRRFPRGKRPAG